MKYFRSNVYLENIRLDDIQQQLKRLYLQEKPAGNAASRVIGVKQSVTDEKSVLKTYIYYEMPGDWVAIYLAEGEIEKNGKVYFSSARIITAVNGDTWSHQHFCGRGDIAFFHESAGAVYDVSEEISAEEFERLKTIDGFKAEI